MNFSLRTKADNTMQQVQTCLNVLVNCERMIQQGGSEPGKAEVTIDTEVRTSIESTMVRACNRLDKILDEDSRWGDIPCVVQQSEIALTLENKIRANEAAQSDMKTRYMSAGENALFAEFIQYKKEKESPIVEATEVQSETAPEQTQRRKKGKK